MNIFIPIETTHRELLYKTFICHHLANNGFKCYLGSKYNISYLINNENNFIYLDKGYHLGYSDSLYRKIEKNNGIIISLDEEGAIDFNDGSTLRGRYSENLFKNSKITFMWGKKQFDLVRKNFFDQNKVFVTGHPRFELIKTKYHYLYEDEINIIKNLYGSFILINTNMSFGNNILGDEFIENNYKNRFKEIKKLIQLDKQKLDKVVELVFRLIKNSKKNIIIRPHPEENQNYYKKIFNQFNNVHVLYEGSVLPWIIASEHLIHPDCTTAIECLISGKIPLSLLPDNHNEEFLTYLPVKVSKCFHSTKILSDYINENNPIKNNKVKKLKIIEDYFSTNLDSSDIIVKKISDYTQSINLSSKDISILTYLNLKVKKVKSLFIPPRFSNSLSRQKLSGFDFEKISLLSSKIKQNNPDIENIKINKLNEFLYSFYSG
tara:strand:+ start:10627 stop:11928 length:1302 start_codon:yes stop_codon:yes gene_type:complete